jgi:hypothetical protein
VCAKNLVLGITAAAAQLGWQSGRGQITTWRSRRNPADDEPRHEVNNQLRSRAKAGAEGPRKVG